MPQVPFRVFFKLKCEIRNKVLIFVSILKHKLHDWSYKTLTKRLFDFQNNWTWKFKFEVRFSFFILIWKMKKQIYWNKYLVNACTQAAIHFLTAKYKILKLYPNGHFVILQQNTMRVPKRSFVFFTEKHEILQWYTNGHSFFTAKLSYVFLTTKYKIWSRTQTAIRFLTAKTENRT